MNPLELVKRTPKSNCGECGYPACLAFAAAVTKSGESPSKCPHLDTTGLELEQNVGAPELEDLAQEKDLQLIAHLKGKVADLNFSQIGPDLGVAVSDTEANRLHFRYLGQDVTLDKSDGILLDGAPAEDPRDQILLYNYVSSCGGASPTNNWIGLESLPNSISKVRTLATYCENVLAGQFSVSRIDSLISLSESIDGQVDAGASASLGLVIPVLPRLPQYILYWEAEPEEGFAAKLKVLFDAKVMDYLDLESLVFSAERMADKFAELAV